LGFEIVEMLVGRAGAVEGMESRSLELGRIWCRIPFDRVGSGYPHIVKFTAVYDGFDSVLKFPHFSGMRIFRMDRTLFSG
jgi:hypothetical protein